MGFDFGIMEVLSVASTAMSVLGSVQQGRQQNDYAQYQADQTRADAVAAQGAAEVQADKVRKAMRMQQSQARASLAASGVDVNSGTSNTINEDIANRGEQDALTALLDGTNQGKRLNSQATGYEISGKNAESAGYSKATGSLLSGGFQIAKGWKKTNTDVYDPKKPTVNSWDYQS